MIPLVPDVPSDRSPKRDCVRPPLLRRIIAKNNARPSGWRRVTASVDGPLVGIKPHTVGNELGQMQRRGVIVVDVLGDGDYDVRVTEAGYKEANG